MLPSPSSASSRYGPSVAPGPIPWAGLPEDTVLEQAMVRIPRIGTEFAGYRLEALLGRGGMGFVYRAEHPRLGTRIALKLLAPELADDGAFRERFVRESRLAASINHPAIITIY